MSVTYSAQQFNKEPNKALPRTVAVVAIALIHAVMFYAFQNGIGKMIITKPPNDLINVQLPPEKSVVEQPPPRPVVKDMQPTPQPEQMPVVELPPEASPLLVDVVIPEQSTITTEAVPQPATYNDAVAIKHRVDPLYPSASRRAGEQGSVVLEVMIDAKGYPTAVNVSRSSGFAALDAAAVEAVRKWRFSYTDTGAKVRVPITFKLNQ